MKHTLLSLFLLISSASIAQHIVSDKVDEFTDNRRIQINAASYKSWMASDGITKNFLKGAVFMSTVITQFGEDKSTLAELNFNIQGKGLLCANDNDAIFILKNKKKITLNQTSKTDCGTTINIKYKITDEAFKEMTEIDVEKLRIYVNEGYMDYDIKDKSKPLIKKTLQMTVDKLKEIE